MNQYITLLGAEQVQNAANTMRTAADEMKQAVANLDHILFQQRQHMDQWLQKFEQILTDNKP